MIKLNYLVKSLAVIALTFFMAMPAMAQAPETPVEFNSVVVENNDGAQDIKLTWKKHTQDPVPHIFFIYASEIWTENEEYFKKVADVRCDPNTETYEYIFRKLSTGQYSFYITAVRYNQNMMYESDRTEILQNEIEQPPEPPYLRIVSEYERQLPVGQKWTYQIKTETNIDCPVKFHIEGNMPDGMTFDADRGYFEWTPEREGQYSFVLIAYIDCEDHELHAYQQIGLYVGHGQNDAWVRIVSEPLTKIGLNQIYRYQVKAESNIRCPILYELLEAPEGMRINKETGVIEWAPSREGNYGVRVKAYLECHPDIHTLQTFYITVGESNHNHHCAWITGQVRNEDGGPVNGVATAWRVDVNDGFGRPFYAGEIQQGAFRINVPEGVYLILFEGEHFIAEWFMDADYIKKAHEVEVKCEHTVEIKAHVKMKPEPKHYIVGGRVVSAKDETPLHAVVEFIPVRSVIDNWPDNNTEVFRTETDRSGYYHIELPDVFTYIARAVPYQESPYLMQYYDRVDHPMEADLIVLEGNLEGINFFLKEKPHYNNGFTGMVINQEREPLLAKVLAYRVGPNDPNTANHKYVRETKTDEHGVYYFKNLPPGEYVVLSIPADRNFIPGYYKDNGIVTQVWREATRIEVGDAMIALVYTSIHEPRYDSPGITEISGRIRGNWNSIKAYDKDSPLDAGDPLGGAFVYLLDNENGIVNYSFSESDGLFSIKEIADGQYTLVVDKPGYDTYTMQVGTDLDENSRVEIEIQLNESLTSVPDEFSIDNMTLYPNPAAKLINISFEGVAGNADIRVYNSMGVQVLSDKTDALQGMNNHILDLGKLPSGSYYIRIDNGRLTGNLGFNIVR